MQSCLWRRRGVLVRWAAVIAAAPSVGLAADNNWIAAGGSGSWSTASNWSLNNEPGATAAFGDATFLVPTPLPAPDALPSVVTLGTGELANSLKFLSSYTLSGGDLTLTTNSVRVNLGETVTLNSQLGGTAGLAKSGGGTLYLANTGNTLTGTIAISNGVLAIDALSALGGTTGDIVVTGSGTRGAGGGSLQVRNVNLARNLTLAGQGPIADRGQALMNYGNSTFTGTVSGNAATNTRITTVGGSVTFASGGTVSVPGTAGTHFTILGSVNQAGSESYSLNGTLSGSGTLEKAGAGTLFLAPTTTSGFSGVLRVSSSATGGNQSSVRVESNGVLGTRTNTGTGAVLDMNGGVLEVRMDTPLVQSGATLASANVYTRASSTIFVDHAVNGTATNGTLTLGTHVLEGGQALTVAGRNGYNITFSGLSTQNTAGNNSTFTNNLQGGLLTFTGNFWSNTDNGAARTLTIGGNGDTLISGDIVASATSFDHILTKTGTGTLTITGTNAAALTTLDGAVNVNGGTVAITDFRSVTNNNATINLGTTTTAGTLQVGTSVVPSAAGLTTSKVINLAGTTGAATILASQAGTDPVILNANFTATGGALAEAKILTLGGINTADNIVNGVIPNNAAGGLVSLVKTGAGTWVLGGTNTYTGSTTVNAGVLKIKAAGASSTVLQDATALGFTLNTTTQTAGGTIDFVGAAAATTEVVGPLAAVSGAGTVKVTSGAGGATLKFASLGTTQTAGAATASTTITVASTAGLVPGMVITGGSAAATVSSITSPTTFVASAAQTFAASTVLTFSRPSGGTVNFVPDASGSVVLASTPVGLVSAYTHFKGADFAYAATSTDATLRAPVYDTDAGFTTVAASGAMSAGGNFLIDANSGTTGTVTQAAVTVSTIKMTSGTTLNNTGVVTIQTAAGSPGGILVSGGSATISGSGITSGGTGDLVIRTDLGTDSLTISAPLTNGTSGGLTKVGLGTLILSSASNAQTGATNINEGTVQLSGTGRLSGANATMNLRQGATLDLNGVSSGTAIGQFNGAGTITNSHATTAAVLTVGNNNGTGTFAGVIQDGTSQVSVTKTGTGGQTWSGLNTYTGATTIASTGVVSVPNLANIGSASSIGAGVATSDATNAASLVFTGTTGGLSYTGAAAASTNRLFTFAGSAASSGARLQGNGVNNAPITWSNPGALVFAGSASGVAQTLTLSGASTGDNRFNPQITDNGAARTSVTKADAGLWHLGNTGNTYTGLTTISAGFLAATTGASLPTNSPLVLGGGQLATSGTFERNLVATATAGNANEVSWTAGGGFSAATTKLTVAIGGVASPTALTWASGGFVTTGNLILNSALSMAELEFRNNIDLGTASRTLQIDDNPNTGADFVTLSGVISGGTGSVLSKSGGGALYLGNSNTYVGSTAVTNGALVVTSLGLSSAPGATSVGDSALGNTTGAITLGNATTTGGALVYIGAGETSDRKIRFNTTTAANQIHASGRGPLILTNVANDMVAGAKTLNLRGASPAVNMITSQLSDNSGALSVTVDGGATWMLTNTSNNFTGAVTVSAGALAILTNPSGNPVALGAGTLDLSNGSIFGYRSDLVMNNTVRVVNNTTTAVIGDYNVTIPTLQLLAAANNVALNGSLVPGKVLTIGTMPADQLTANRTMTLGGTGDTVVTGDFTTTTTFGLNVTYNGAATGRLILNNTQASANSALKTGTNVTASAGSLGIGTDTSLGLATLVMNNGTVFASGGDRTIANNASQPNNVGATFNGDNSLTINGTYALGTTANSPTITNNIVAGKSLTLTSMTFNAALTANRTLTVAGSGATNLANITTTQTLFNLSLTYSGTSTLTITGTSNLVGLASAGGAAVSATGAGGKLLVASGSITALSANVNNATATIGGGGSIVAPLTITSGTLAPGNSVGTLTAGNSTTTNGLTFTGATSNLLAELDATTGDKVDVVGNTTGAGTSHLRISLVNGAVPENVTYVLIDNNGTAATPKLFADVQLVSGGNGPQPAATFVLDATTSSLTDWIATDAGGNFFRIDYGVDAGLGRGTAANDVVLTVTAVPEPATAGLLALAGIGLLSGRRRTRSGRHA